MSYNKNRIAALIVCLTLATSGTLSGCGSHKSENPAADSSVSETTADTSSAAETEPASSAPDGSSETASSSSESETAPADEEKIKTGSPWDTTVESGCLPPEKPALCDDLYTYFNYDFLSAHQDSYFSSFDEHTGEVSNAVREVMKDTSKNSHALEQMRIFYDQAVDIEGRKGTGNADIQPYLDKIDSAGSVKELGEVITADDFPFSPFLLGTLAVTDTRGKNMVALVPNLLIVDPITIGGAYYNDLDVEENQDMLEMLADDAAIGLVPDFRSMGMDYGEAYYAVMDLAEFEKDYGRYVDYDGKYNKAEFGEDSKSIEKGMISAEELYKLSPNYPMKRSIEKIGKDGCDEYYIGEKEWVTVFNDLWKDENLDKLKLMAKAKILDETRPYRDPTEYYAMLELCQLRLPTDDEYAMAACDSLDTFSHVISQTYVEDCLGQKAVDRITDVANNIVSSYEKMINETEWLDEKSRAAMLEKLKNMTFNVLQPVDGFMDYSDVELVPTEKGGTLFGNFLLLKKHRQEYEKKLIGKKATSSNDWYLLPPTMDNSFYDPTNNSISIMPGNVTSLFYTDDMPESKLYSGIGFSIGHEICHAFDFSGAQYDAYGQANPVFDGDDLDDFLEKTNKLADYYSTIEITDGKQIDGKNIVGEAAADLSSMQILLETVKDKDIDYTEFFKNFAYIWAEVLPEGYAAMIATDVHPLNNLRVNVSVQMVDELYDKLGVKEGDNMYLAPEKRVLLWGKNS